ncbi:NEAT domain-containing protein [Inediibacterium massiliense]|uniref:NEAT domain-containing protein n=1 Tax=Inediibacterium massiliense TaxID=1658111 RepID=UPI0006B582F8|nr:NEAT domain-containing protein [Inediibacterium massiliense]
MKNKMLKICTVTFVVGALLLPSTQAFAQKAQVSKVKATQKVQKVVEKEPLKVGKYNVGVTAVKAKSNEMSMAGQYMDTQAVLEVTKDKQNKEKRYLEIKLTRSDWMENIKVNVGDKEVAYTAKVLKTYKEKNEAGKNKADSSIRFEIPNSKSGEKPNIKLGMNVIPMGNASVEFRVQLGDEITKVVEKAISNNPSTDKKAAKK